MISLITTIKNRAHHLWATGPTLIAQSLPETGLPYDLIIVDYHSEDEFFPSLPEWLKKRQPWFSASLRSIHVVRLVENLKFDSCKAKNVGFIYSHEQLPDNQYVAFSDIDTFLFPDYLDYWVGKLNPQRFMTSRGNLHQRVRDDVNYGNFIVHKDSFHAIQGHNESVPGYGGDDDEVWHRLSNYGLEEIHPATPWEARQTSIVHGNEERYANLEAQVRRFGNGLNLAPAGTTWRDFDTDWFRPQTTVTTYATTPSIQVVRERI